MKSFCIKMEQVDTTHWNDYCLLYILLLSHSCRLSTLGNRVWTKMYTLMIFGQGGVTMCKIRVKETGKWGRRGEQKWVQLSVILQENAISCIVIWEISGQASWNHCLWELSLGFGWGVVEEWVIHLVVPLSLICQVHSRGHQFSHTAGFHCLALLHG